MTAPSPAEVDARVHVAMDAIQTAFRRYCEAANRGASDSVCAERWREFRRAQRAFHDLSAELYEAGRR